MNYKVTKIGLLNFWYFDDEVFEFYDGKLLLRGGNGSGKSVTMQSFIPLILDGNKTPSRLDPFGTKEKRIEDYLLGPSDSQQEEDAIAYLYMETYNKEKEKYLTIGIGLHAKRGRPTDFWGFALKDGKRIGIDFNLYKSYSNKVLMTKKELKANIGIDNLFVETQKEYKTMVNELLFGFKDINSYDEFINVLLQLRSPKLSKEYTPTKLMAILSSVLQPLTDDDIRPLSEAIEDTNKTREKINTLNSNIKALSNLLKVYQNYNEINLYNKALNVFEINKVINNDKKSSLEKEKNIKNIQSRLKEIEENINKLEQELVEITTKLSSIDNKDIKNYTEQLNELNDNISKTNTLINTIKSRLENQLDKERKNTNDIKLLEDKIFQKEQEITTTITDIISLNEEVKLQDINLNITKQEINFDYLLDRVNKYKNKLNLIKLKLEEKEQLENNLSNLEIQHEKLKKEENEKELIKRNHYKELNIEIDNFKDKFNKLESSSKVVKIEEDRKRKIFQLINDYSSINYLSAKEEFLKETKHYTALVTNEKIQLENKIANEKNNLKTLTEQLELLITSDELELLEKEELKEASNKLNSLNIPFIPLYKVIEFKDSISEEEKNNIEEILLSLNILNAKLVPNKYLNKIKNINSVFLKQGTKKKNNILNYFNILENEIISSEELENILSSISIDSTEVFYINKDNYELDFLIGYPSGKYESKYIGLLKRKEEHQRKIKEKQIEIETSNTVINNYNNILNNLLEKLNDIVYMETNFPNNILLEEINTNIIKITTSLENIFERSKYLTEEINNINNLIKLKIEEINKIKDNIAIPLNLMSYKNAINLTSELTQNINNLKNIFEVKNNYLDQKLSKELINEDINTEIEYQNAEILEKTKLYNELLTKKKATEEILSNKEYQKIIKEVKELTERKNKIPTINNQLREEKGKLYQALETLKDEIEKDQITLNKNILMQELKYQILIQEYNLNYVYKDEELNVNKILQDLKSRENSDITRAFENYIMAFNNYKQDLLDYHLNTKEIFSNNIELIQIYLEKGLTEKEINEVLSNMNRQDLETVYQGRKMNIYELTTCLNEAIKESENYIKIEERHLFEDILLKTVGNKIRDRINSSKEWVQKINEIMKNTQIDSNLSFELEWKSKTAFTEEELDTKEIVRLLKIDAGQLLESDSQKLRTHFQSRIKQELEFNEKANESYANIIFKVLDYRNWFEFKMFYKRKSGEKKELTNKMFSVFSGGERAKSMYVPLFAAIYAKLLNASSNSLKLIALDEAFAGVDNDNIREMFNILSQLDLDYILTSQSLWGDYDTVKELSICELLKDEVHKAVGVRHYRWNGLVKEVLE